MRNVIEVLRARGLLEDVTSPDLAGATNSTLTVYAGFDPTSDSLQAGNFLAIMALAHFQRCGHKVIVLVGGATGMVGDPSGKRAERRLLDAETVARNLSGIRKELARILDFEHPTAPACMVDNGDWFGRFSFVDFLRDVGRHFRMGSMLSRESVRARLESESGMSFAEFSYPLMQAYDYLHLFDTMDCSVQIGGSDQWGNITAGIELIRKLRGREAYGLTFPLVCDSVGRKFGKSEGNAVYLDPRRTSYYDFYQFFVRTMDADVIRFLRMFTFVPLDEIRELEAAQARNPENRPAQKRLAEEVTRIVHGEHGLRIARQASEALFGGSLEGLSADDLLGVFANVGVVELPVGAVAGAPVADVAVCSGLSASKSAARRLIANGGFYINNVRITAPDGTVRAEHITDGKVLVLRSGKKTYRLVKIAGTRA